MARLLIWYIGWLIILCAFLGPLGFFIWLFIAWLVAASQG